MSTPVTHIDVADLYSRLGNIEAKLEALPEIRKDIEGLHGFKARIIGGAAVLSAVVSLLMPFVRSIIPV